MIAEILSTGDEVLLGDIVDTNSSWLCRELAGLGVVAARVTAVGDRAEDIAAALEQIAGRADVCLVTGGLGPTGDDVTAFGCARACGTVLERNALALSSMIAYFKRRGWLLTPENEGQAMLPKGAKVLENTHGTAPGFQVEIAFCIFYFMPGVPEEMKQMFRQKVRPQLAERLGVTEGLAIRRFTVFGLPESQVGGRLSGFESVFSGIRLGFRAKFPLIEVKLVGIGEAFEMDPGKENIDNGRENMDKACRWVEERLGNKIVSHTGLTLEEEVGKLLSKANQTLSTAESCTGGLISHKITEVSGASAYFLFSAVTYANSAKENILNVSRQTLESVGAVHEETARQMAAGARMAGGSDWAVATTGIAGPSGGTKDKPVGTVCVGVAGPSGVSARRFVLDTGDRAKNKALFAATALEMLRREIAASSAEG